MLTADTRNFFGRAREEDFVRAGVVLSMEGSAQAGCPPRSHSANTVYEITMSSNKRGLPLRWGLAFASLGELVRTSSADLVTAGRVMQSCEAVQDAPCAPRTTDTPYTSYKSYRTYEAKAVGKCLEFEAKAHHQSSIIK